MAQAKVYRAAVIGCSRMGGFIDNEIRYFQGDVLPVSHAASYRAVARTELVACADLRQEIMAAFGALHGIPPERQYTDYRAMIERERPDIVSITTQPEHRAEIAIFAAENGVKALYCEKPLCASMEEADRLTEAVERNGVRFTMGVNYRWDSGTVLVKEMLAADRVGALQTILLYPGRGLFNMGSHALAVAQFLNDDVPAAWVQATVVEGEVFQGDVIVSDPQVSAIIGWESGVTAHLVASSRSFGWEAICQRGTLGAQNNHLDWEMRLEVRTSHGGTAIRPVTFPAFERRSATVRLIEDLVQALDRDDHSTACPIRVARANMELIMACLESHRRGGVRITLPLEGCTLRLDRKPVPRMPVLSPGEKRVP